MPPRLWLARHGRTRYNAEGRAQGHTDVPLDEVGESQAARLCERLAISGPKRAVASDLLRARQTVAPLAAAGWEVEEWPELRERGFGEWEGLAFEEIRPLMRQGARPPGGEDEHDVWARACEAAARLESMPSPALVVSHGFVLSMLLARLLGGGPGLARGFRWENGALTELAPASDGLWRLLRFNDASHLEDRDPALAPR